MPRGMDLVNNFVRDCQRPRRLSTAVKLARADEVISDRLANV